MYCFRFHLGNRHKNIKGKMVQAAAGADVIKFQTFRAESLVTRTVTKAAYQHQTTAPKVSQVAMFKKLELPYDAHQSLIACCRKHQIRFLSTPFDLPSVDWLRQLLSAKICWQNNKICHDHPVKPETQKYSQKHINILFQAHKINSDIF